MISVTVVVGPLARLFTRQMYFTLLPKSKWDDTFFMPEVLLEKVKFWHQHMYEPSADSKSDLISSLFYRFIQTLTGLRLEGF